MFLRKQLLQTCRRRLFSSSAVATTGKERLIIFDTTLRDGEQSPGATLNIQEKLEIAKLLSRLGVDVCEAGFPIASPGDFQAVQTIAKEIGPLVHNREELGPMTICGLSRSAEKDILRCYEAVKEAPRHRIHTFLATSDIHLEHKLKITRDECIERAVKAVELAASLVEDVEFSTEDACRSDPDFLVQMVGEVIRAGAKTINMPDTVGYTTPEEYQKLFEYVIANAKDSHKAVFSTHCHNDLGLATANTLAGVAGGARQVELTVNGIGERAGNTSIEEIAMAIRTRPTKFNVYTSLDTTMITKTSRVVSTLTGMVVQPNKAIVGANAFAHESGIHQDGVLKNPDTYEIMDPKTVGLNTNNLVLGKLSGKSAYKSRLIELGYTELSDEQITELVQKFKKLADEKKVVTDADIEAIVNDDMFQPSQVWNLLHCHVTGGNRVRATATVTLEHIDGHEVTEACVGTGPVDAIYQAIHKVIRVPNRLVSFNVASVTKGIDAIGEVTTKLECPLEFDSERKQLKRIDSGADVNEFKNPQTGSLTNRVYTGHGTDVDILVAAGRSYLAALNKMIFHQQVQMKKERDQQKEKRQK